MRKKDNTVYDRYDSSNVIKDNTNFKRCNFRYRRYKIADYKYTWVLEQR